MAIEGAGVDRSTGEEEADPVIDLDQEEDDQDQGLDVEDLDQGADIDTKEEADPDLLTTRQVSLCRMKNLKQKGKKLFRMMQRPEKRLLIPGSQSSATPKSDNSGPSKPGGDEFSSLDNVMNSVLEAVAPKPLEKV